MARDPVLLAAPVEGARSLTFAVTMIATIALDLTQAIIVGLLVSLMLFLRDRRGRRFRSSGSIGSKRA